MRQDRPSLTAHRVALSRAAHQLFDDPRVLDDPIALRILGERAAHEIQANRKRFAGKFARHLRAFLVARSRVAEDALAQAVERGVHQYVILGAGLDTFAYRNPYADTVQVFEVDHPATQAWKRRLLSAAGIGIPASLHFVPIDFETQTLAAGLRHAGFSTEEPAFFSWLGVSMYLTREAIVDTLRFVARLPRGSGIVFDYALAPHGLNLPRRMIAGVLLRRVASVGEPWKTFFEPRQLADELTALGFEHIEDFGAAELNARFFAGRSDELSIAGLGRLMSARV